MNSIDNQIKNYKERFENLLESTLNNLDKNAPKIITDSMKYAIIDGGKRVRPILCYATADMLNVPLNNVDNLALAIEFIHSYSLVHDDLPAMDNDDYRRGKLSTHKKFGEANGILCGDAMLNFATEIALNSKIIDENYIKAVKFLFNCSGYMGMVAGQVLDLDSEHKKNVSKDLLYSIYENKTAKLITAPIICASLVSGGKYYNELISYSYNLGILFQIVDDIMDEEGSVESIGKTPHKDKEVDKLTSIKIFGLNKAKEIAKNHYLMAIDSIKDIKNNDFLIEFANKMYIRKK